MLAGIVTLLSILIISEVANSFNRNVLHYSGIRKCQTDLIISNSPLTSFLSSKPIDVDINYNNRLINNPNLSDEEEESSEEEEEEPSESSESSSSAEVDDSPQISLIKQGLNISSSMNGSDVRVGIIMARWNADVIQGLYKGVNESLTKCSVKPSNIFTTYVPGAFELPITAKFLAASKRVDVIICLGCLIKGDTMHFEYIADAVAKGIMQVSLDTYVPCLFGVLTVLNKEQAIVRSQGPKNEGTHWGLSAVEMGLNRLSALGMDKKPSESDKPGDPFLNTAPTKKNETKKTFGF